MAAVCGNQAGSNQDSSLCFVKSWLIFQYNVVKTIINHQDVYGLYQPFVVWPVVLRMVYYCFNNMIPILKDGHTTIDRSLYHHFFALNRIHDGCGMTIAHMGL